MDLGNHGHGSWNATKLDYREYSHRNIGHRNGSLTNTTRLLLDRLTPETRLTLRTTSIQMPLRVRIWSSAPAQMTNCPLWTLQDHSQSAGNKLGISRKSRPVDDPSTCVVDSHSSRSYSLWGGSAKIARKTFLGWYSRSVLLASRWPATTL